MKIEEVTNRNPVNDMTTPPGTERTGAGLIVPQGTQAGQGSRPSLDPIQLANAHSKLKPNNQDQEDLLNKLLLNIQGLDYASASELYSILKKDRG